MAGISRKVGGARRRKTVCWSRMSKKGRYVVCNRSKGQRLCEKRKGKIKRKIRVIRVKRDRHAQDGTLTFN